MDAFAKLARQDSDGKGNILIDVSLDGRFVAFNDASAQLWKADGRLLQMPTASLLDAHCYELRPQRDFFDSFLANFVCSGIKVHPRAAFVLICGTLVRIYSTTVHEPTSLRSEVSQNTFTYGLLPLCSHKMADPLMWCCWWIPMLLVRKECQGLRTLAPRTLRSVLPSFNDMIVLLGSLIMLELQRTSLKFCK